MRYKHITSTENRAIKDTLAMLRKKPGYEAFLIEGWHLIESALNAGVRLKRVFVSREFSERTEAGVLEERLAGVEAYEVLEHIMKKLSDTETPQGILAVASYAPPRLESLAFKTAPLLVVSDGISDPGNIGALVRVADASGADAFVILPGSCDLFMPKAIRASQGSIFNIPVVHSSAGELISWARGKGIRIVSALQTAHVSVYQADLKVPLAFVFGNESRGVSGEISASAEMSLAVPMRGKAESLNVASAAAVFLFEAMRQRGLP